MKKKVIMFALLFLICLTLTVSLFVLTRPAEKTYTKYQTVFYDAFDTVIQLIGFTPSEQEFNEAAATAQSMLTHYHQLFNQYEEYPGIVNVCVLNQKAKDGPVQVSRDLFDLLALCQDLQNRYGSLCVNVSMGSVLSLWHEARENGLADLANAKLPDMALLQEASGHTSISDLILDRDRLTVYYADPLLQLDLGAIAKGYAAEKVRQKLLQSSMNSFILNAGGNICLGNPPRDGRDCWSVGIQDPDNLSSYIDVLYLSGLNVVTSGDYQRFYVVDGVRYSHLISPKTLMPAAEFRSVTVVGPDGGFCDFLSTWLFIADYEEGRALIDSLEGVEAYWLFCDGTVRMTDGMKLYARSAGAAQ